MTEWFEGRSVDEQKMERCYWRRVGFVVFLAVLMALVLLPLQAYAEPLYVAETGGIRITLHSEPCELGAVTNLKMKATWVENGKVSQGCWAATPFGVVVAYFDDKTVATIPVQAFAQVQGV
jgi:hypothetical protein